MDRRLGAAPDVAGRVAVVTGASRGLLQLKRDESYNSPGWVADRILGLAFGGAPPQEIVVRVPDEPRGQRGERQAADRGRIVGIDASEGRGSTWRTCSG
jgi:hypothetical protein